LAARRQTYRVLSGKHLRPTRRETKSALIGDGRAAHMRTLVAQIPQGTVDARILSHRTQIANHLSGGIQNFDLSRTALLQVVSDRSSIGRIGSRERLFPPWPMPPPPRPPPPSKRRAGRM